MSKRGAGDEAEPVPDVDTGVDEDTKVWKDRIRFLLKARRLNMRSASLRAGLGETFFRDMLERGRMPKFENARRIAEALDVSVGTIWTDYAPSPVNPLPSGAEVVGGSFSPVDEHGIGGAQPASAGTLAEAQLLLRLAFLVNQHFKALGVEPSPEKWQALAGMLHEIRKNER